MALLSLEELQDTCDIIKSNVMGYRPNYLYYYSTIWMTGCRPAELLMPELWSIDFQGNVILQPLKNNNPRTFDAQVIPEQFYDAILNNDFPYDMTRFKSIRRAFNYANVQGSMYVEDDNISMRVYRYVVAKQMKEDGFTYAQIQSYFGWTNINMAIHYVNKDIYRDQ